jgi:hypothetical protein
MTITLKAPPRNSLKPESYIHLHSGVRNSTCPVQGGISMFTTPHLNAGRETRGVIRQCILHTAQTHLDSA